MCILITVHHHSLSSITVSIIITTISTTIIPSVTNLQLSLNPLNPSGPSIRKDKSKENVWSSDLDIKIQFQKTQGPLSLWPHISSWPQASCDLSNFTGSSG